MRAAKSGCERTLNILLEAGADLTCRNGRGDNALHLAAMEGHHKIVKTLLDHGLDVNTRGWNDTTPLMSAAVFGRESYRAVADGYERTVNILIEAGADITCQDQSGNNALYMAVLGGNRTIFQTLLKLKKEEK